MVAPFNSRHRFYDLIQQEIENAKAGKEAYMVIKVNSIQDKEMAEKLYKASQAGVKIKIIARFLASIDPSLVFSKDLKDSKLDAYFDLKKKHFFF